MLDEFLGKVVVLDTDAPFTYIGTLRAHDDRYYRLRDVNIYHRGEARISGEQYLVECARLGHVAHRNEVLVRVARVVSLSPLAAVVVPGGAGHPDLEP